MGASVSVLGTAEESGAEAHRAPSLVFDHLGVIVAELGEGRAFLQGTLGITLWSPVVEDEELGVDVQFGAAPAGGGPIYELVAPRPGGSPITGQLARSRGVLNHVAYRTLDLPLAGEHLRANGCFPTGDPRPARAYGGAEVQFWVSPLRFLIELIGKGEHVHALEHVPGGPPVPSPNGL